MSRTLYLVRHAQAESANSGQKDLERRLTSEGVRDANHLGMFLANSQINPDLIMVSPASRAWDTAEILAEQMKYGVDKIKKEDELYEAPIRILLRIINELSPETDNHRRASSRHICLWYFIRNRRVVDCYRRD